MLYHQSSGGDTRARSSSRRGAAIAPACLCNAAAPFASPSCGCASIQLRGRGPPVTQFVLPPSNRSMAARLRLRRRSARPARPFLPRAAPRPPLPASAAPHAALRSRFSSARGGRATQPAQAQQQVARAALLRRRGRPPAPRAATPATTDAAADVAKAPPLPHRPHLELQPLLRAVALRRSAAATGGTPPAAPPAPPARCL